MNGVSRTCSFGAITKRCITVALTEPPRITICRALQR